MKKHLSVLMLFTRSTLYKALLIILVMAAGESALFLLAFRGAQGFFGLDTMLDASHLGWVCAVGFLLLGALLCLTGCEFGSKQGYTLARLRVSRRAVFIWQAVHNAGLLFLFWAAQVGIIWALGGIYTAQYPQPQAVMLVFYQNPFLHSLLPLAEWSRLVCNLALLVALAATAACFPVQLRRGKKPLAAFILAALCLQNFTQGVGHPVHDFVLAALALFIAFTAIINGVWKEALDETLS
jgi:hypothetical protein